MDSNNHGTTEQNEEDILMNNLIYGTRKTELRMRSYGMMNSAWNVTEKDLERIRIQP